MKDKDHLKNIPYGFLHNRKTGGTAIKDVLEQQRTRTPQMRIAYFKHAMVFPRFIRKQPNTHAIFIIREPISRFVSGFYSRQRQGKPKYNIPWTAKEALAFGYFPTANSLAEALSAKSWLQRRRARAAMKSIINVCHTYHNYFGSLRFLKKHAHRIAYIGHQPEIEADIVRIKSLCDLDEDLTLPNDDVRAHRNPAHVDKHLSEIAIANLKKWYAKDFAIYAWCLEKRNSIITLGSNFL